MNQRFALLAHDLKTALTGFRRRPLYAALAAGMLACGLAANVAVFTVISRTLLRPMHFRDAGQLVHVATTHRDSFGKTQEFQSGSIEFVHWRLGTKLLPQLAVARSFPTSINTGGETEPIARVGMSGNLFSLLGVSPLLGHDFSAADDRPNASVIAISYGLWQRRFGADPRVLGRTVFVDGKPVSIVAVMPRDFEVPLNQGDVYYPLGLSLANMPDRPSRFYEVFGRLAPGATPLQAEAELQRVSRQLEKTFPDSNRDYSARVKPLREALYGDRKPALLALFTAVLLVHLLACVNVANLMLAQIADQRGATAVRMALGATRRQLLRYRFVESLLVTAAGTLAGLLLGSTALRLILANYANTDLATPAAGSGWMIALFLTALAVVTALVVAVVPAFREARLRIAGVINEGSHRTSSSVSGTRVRELFIIAEVALAVPLLLAAAVTVKRFRDLQTFDIGYDTTRIMTSQMVLPSRYAKPDRVRFVTELQRRISAIPGVESAALTTCTFKDKEGPGTVVRTERSADDFSVGFRRITPSYFETMRIRLIAGRNFTPADALDAPPVAIVSQSFAKQYWPGESAIGKKLRRAPPNPWATVIGVVPDVRDSGVATDGGPVMYVPFYQTVGPFISVVARAKGDPEALRKPLQRALASVDRDLAFGDQLPLARIVEETLAGPRLQVSLLGGFALIAVLLAAVGIYGVTSYAVSQRMREVGVRMAFGATPRVILLELLRRATRSVTIGLAAGLALALGALRLLPDATGNFDVRYAAAVIVLLLTSALLASFVPALRARNASPNLLLREA